MAEKVKSKASRAQTHAEKRRDRLLTFHNQQVRGSSPRAGSVLQNPATIPRVRTLSAAPNSRATSGPAEVRLRGC